jgi:hypothetical protein
MDLVRYLLLENPLSPCIALGLIALGAAFFWSRTGSRRARAAALACCGLAAALFLVAWLVETDRERVGRTLDLMSSAASRGDAEALIAQISPDYDAAGGGKAALANVVQMGLRLVRASADDPAIAMEDGRATVTQVYHFRPAPNSRLVVPTQYETITWEGTFAPDADGRWRLRSAAATKPEPMSPQDAARGLMKLAAQFSRLP